MFAMDGVKMIPETGTAVRSATIPEHYYPWKHKHVSFKENLIKKQSSTKLNALCYKFKNEEKTFKKFLES
jgi:hypothetical protein